VIDKLIAIRSVGKFWRYSAHGQTNFQRLTLIFAENGCGKTTLAAILKSLAADDGMLIAERKTLGSPDEPRIELRSSAAAHVFEGGQWNSNFTNIEVFDDAFIYGNVYAGPLVTLEQRRSLHKIIIGSHGVTLAREIEQLNEQIKNINYELQYLTDQIRPYASALTVEQFCRLAPVEGVDERIAAKLIDLEARRNIVKIRTTTLFNHVALPPVSVGELEQLLRSGIEDLSAESEHRLQEHFLHIGTGAETWLANGISRIANETCPFCLQNISSQSIIGDYRAHFGASYRELKARITRRRDEIDRFFSGDRVAEVLQEIARQDAARAFWSNFVSVPADLYPLGEIRSQSANLRNMLLQHLDRKAASPLEAIALSAEDMRAVRDYEAVKTTVQEITNDLIFVNAAIQEVKDRTDAGSVQEIEAELALLRAAKSRYSEPASNLCQTLSDTTTRKTEAEQRKSQRRDVLSAHTASIFPAYQAAINGYLEKFGAEFRVGGVATENPGGKPGSRYQIEICGVSIELGNENTPPGTPCFRNTLSAGDRNGLALAFFFAQLDQDAGLASKVVVLDDPISSFDDQRATATKHIICNLASTATQVIVFSHSAQFLKRVWDQQGTPPKKPLKLRRCSDGVELVTWDIQAETQTDYHRLHAVLAGYVGSHAGSPREVAASIRPFLEGLLRIVYPAHFRPEDWVGDFVLIARSAAASSQPIMPDTRLHELEEIVDYSKRYHHSTNLSWETEPINETELESFVRRTLQFPGS
jgi:wobble nucleotide-excising tRNase